MEAMLAQLPGFTLTQNSLIPKEIFFSSAQVL